MKPIKVGLLMMGALLAGCTDASEPTTDEAREREQLEKQLKAIPGAEKRQVLMPDFMPMMGQLQECQGRAVFSVQGGLQWGGYWEGGYKEGFGEKLYMESGTGIDIDNMSIRLVANVPKGILTEILEDERSSLKALIRDTKQEIQKLHGFIELLQEDMARDPDKAEGISSAIADYKADISEKEKKLAKQLAAKPEKDWGIPDSLVWNDVRFYLWREGVLFIVEQSFSNSENEPGFSISNPYFQQLAKRLRYRKPNEIPKEIGLCIPYGFIEDDGTLTYEINTT
ncbi:hypothetical protein HNQ59_004000, partial [Chitinivorax tropicus]|nr:hypothetical protein [Chitinivorax tropicus]